MIQSRAQFGTLGALLVVVIAGVMYIGFFAPTSCSPANRCTVWSMPYRCRWASSSVPWVQASSASSAIASSTCSTALAPVLGIGIVVGFGYIFSHVQSDDFLTRGGFNLAGWLATVSLAALWQIAFAPYVSDYSRYLPADVKVSSTFWTTYLAQPWVRACRSSSAPWRYWRFRPGWTPWMRSSWPPVPWARLCWCCSCSASSATTPSTCMALYCRSSPWCKPSPIAGSPPPKAVRCCR